MRLRWLRYRGSPGLLSDLASQMARDTYDGRKNWGFRIDNASSDEVRGRFIVKEVIEDRVVDPLGNETSVERVNYVATDFRLLGSDSLIELADPPRTVRPFLNQLGSYSDFTVSVDEVRLDLGAFLRALGAGEQQPRVSGVRLGSVELGVSIVGKLEAAGSGDVQGTVAALLKGRKYKLEAVRTAVVLSGMRHDITVSAAASLTSKRSLDMDSRNHLRGCCVASIHTDVAKS